MTPEQIRALLKVEPHATCGFVRVILIPANTFYTARILPESFRGWFPGASTERPGVPADVEIRIGRKISGRGRRSARISTR